jgi:formate hydrogenlyase transcriptional activator
MAYHLCFAIDFRVRMQPYSSIDNLSPAQLLHQLPVSAFVLDAQHKVLIWNYACERLTGIAATDMLGSDQHWRGFYTRQRPCLADLMLDGNLQASAALYDCAGAWIADTGIYHTENWCLMPDGRRLYLVIDVRPILDSVGNTVAVIETQRDRTEQRLMMQALAASEQRVAAILASTMDAIITLDRQRQITLFNPAAERMFGCTSDLALGRPLLHFVAPACAQLFQQFIDGAQYFAHTPRWVPQGLLARRADGSQFAIEATFSPMQLEDQLCTIILRDINDKHLAEQQLHRLQQEKGYLQEVLNDEHNPQQFVSGSPLMRKVMEQVRMVAVTDTPVLLLGETGTGKELLAQSIHQSSERRQAIMVKVNCAALPEDLIESELFGHEKGAFTGALLQRKGRFELADGGSLFLDEVGELPPAAQAKLLRVLQEQEFERVGGSQTLRVNVRIIAATHRNLAEDVASGRFRADLYYRLHVFPIDVPALRQRAEDIPLLARFFLDKFAKKFAKPFSAIDAESLQHLRQYTWPGNVRELQNVIERAVILSAGPLLEVETLAAGPRSTGALRTLEAVEREYILSVLNETVWVIAGSKGAAAILGLNPNTLRSRMVKLGIRRA